MKETILVDQFKVLINGFEISKHPTHKEAILARIRLRRYVKGLIWCIYPYNTGVDSTRIHTLLESLNFTTPRGLTCEINKHNGID